MSVTVHENDLPAGLDLGPVIAVDSETMGLDPRRDRLCVVQLSCGDGDAHIVQLDAESFEAPKLNALLTDPKVIKIFHYARFDVAMMAKWLDIVCAPVWCTKIASKLARTYTDRHGLKDLLREMLNVDISKAQQSSDWGADELTEAQLSYAATDVLYLHRLREGLIDMLEREGRLAFAEASFDFLPVRALLDLEGWADTDIFAHS